ncbi:hypothetical protein DBR11_20890 [Pedobacter sp. HMWF019]|uniref:hypothetical protein n=1 Tax=Pedobacter sp. HMWF019 TaxID=2056856 RepID=UPI000D378B48|nr:hypothetical protein [Pedobacter sp. HMWF019]PTS95638.1 hypothetical protein DBR11_20890 [Pedobacter sp. HMWF019]
MEQYNALYQVYPFEPTEQALWLDLIKLIDQQIHHADNLYQTLRYCYEMQQCKGNVNKKLKTLYKLDYDTNIITIIQNLHNTHTKKLIKKDKFKQPFNQLLHRKIRILQALIHKKHKKEKAKKAKCNYNYLPDYLYPMLSQREQENTINEYLNTNYQYTIQFGNLEKENQISSHHIDTIVELYELIREVKLINKHKLILGYHPETNHMATILDKELLEKLTSNTLKPCPANPEKPYEISLIGDGDLLLHLNDIIDELIKGDLDRNFVKEMQTFPKRFPYFYEIFAEDHFRYEYTIPLLGRIYNQLIYTRAMIYCGEITQRPSIAPLQYPKKKKEAI